jgi:hypothetical protein
MEKALREIENAVAFLCSALITATSFGYIAFEEFGIPPAIVRRFTLLAAAFVAGGVVVAIINKAPTAR